MRLIHKARFALFSGRALAASTTALLTPISARADNTPECNDNQTHATSVECGSSSSAISVFSATASHISAIGPGAFAVETNATAVGADANAIASPIGLGISIASPAPADESATAVGGGAFVHGIGSVAVGDNSLVSQREFFGPTYSNSTPIDAGTAIGSNTLVVAEGGTALGYRSQATAANAVAIGANSLADEAGTVSFGRFEAERQLVHVADGSIAASSTDAVNGRQLNATNLSVAANSTGIAANATAISANASAIAAIDTDMSAMEDDIAANRTATQANATAIAANADGIGMNLAAIVATQAALTENRTYIDENRTLLAANTAAIGILQDQMELIAGDVAENRADIERLQEGVAMALALDSPALPAGTSFALSGGAGVYQGKGSFALALTAAVAETTSVSAGFGVGTDSGEFGGRAGFQIAW